MATITAQAITAAGLVPSTTAACASGGDCFSGNEIEFVYVKNGSGSARTLTVTAQKACSYGSVHSITYSVGASTSVMLGKFPIKWFNTSSDMVYITASIASDMTIGVFSLA